MILIINPNSTVAMTTAMLQTARATCPDQTIEAWTSHDGPPAIQGPQDGAACVPPLLELVAKARGAKAIIIGCADDTGLDQARDIAPCPVIGIGQAAYHLASLVAPRFSVVTTLAVSVPVIADNIARYGLGHNLVRVRASGVPVLDLEQDPETTTPRVLAEIDRAITQDGVQTVVLGCAGMMHIPDAASFDPSVRLIDGVRAAIRFASVF